jgi:protein-disulfide isomerase
MLVFFSGSSGIDVSKVDAYAVQTANSQDGKIADHIYGKVGSKVTLIEYGDFQCSACGDRHPYVKAIIEQYKDQVQFIFRNFPLPATEHPNARAAAAAVEAAGLQGKYWEMHNKIYESQADWSSLSGDGTGRTAFFVKSAKELGLDTTKFKTDLDSTSITNKVDYDYALGKKIGVNATPSFYLDGTHLGSDNWNDNVFSTNLKTAINAELKKAGIALPESTE